MCPNTFDYTERFQRHLSLVVPRHVISGKTERADTGAKTALQTSLGQVVEHGDFWQPGSDSRAAAHRRVVPNGFVWCVEKPRRESCRGLGTRKNPYRNGARRQNKNPSPPGRPWRRPRDDFYKDQRRNAPECRAFACDRIGPASLF